MEERVNVTFGLWGEELKEWQAIQRLVVAGFHDPRVLLDMFAVIEGESGSYTKAWHANVKRVPADENDTPPFGGAISYDDQGRMIVRSIDLGFIQRNVDVSDTVVEPTEEAMRPFVETMFASNPLLARADTAAEIAYDLWRQRGFQPWYAYKPGSEAFKIKKRYGAKAIGNYLLRTQVGKMEVDDGRIPRLEFVK